MITLFTKDLSGNEARKLLSGSILPRPIALVSTTQENNLVNVAPFSWFNMVNASPPMISISVRYDTDNQKDTSRNIMRNKEFVVHIISEDFLEKANKTAVSLSPFESELTYADLMEVESSIISTKGIKEAKVRLECVLETTLHLEQADLIIGRVVAFHFDEEVYLNGKIDFKKLNPVSRLSGKRYGLIGKVIEIDE